MIVIGHKGHTNSAPKRLRHPPLPMHFPVFWSSIGPQIGLKVETPDFWPSPPQPELLLPHCWIIIFLFCLVIAVNAKIQSERKCDTCISVQFVFLLCCDFFWKVNVHVSNGMTIKWYLLVSLLVDYPSPHLAQLKGSLSSPHLWTHR